MLQGVVDEDYIFQSVESGWRVSNYFEQKFEKWNDDVVECFAVNDKVLKLLSFNIIACTSLLQVSSTPTRYTFSHTQSNTNSYISISDLDFKLEIVMIKEKCMLYYPLLPSFTIIEEYITEDSYNRIVDKVNQLFREIDNIMNTNTPNVYDVQRRIRERN